MFHVGQEVVCIPETRSGKWYNVKSKRRADPSIMPEEGKVYTVTGLAQYNGGLFLCLKGFSGAYTAFRFRPIVKRKTDISIFTRMLKSNELEKV